MIFINVQSLGNQMMCAEYDLGDRRGEGQPDIQGVVVFNKRGDVPVYFAKKYSETPRIQDSLHIEVDENTGAYKGWIFPIL